MYIYRSYPAFVLLVNITTSNLRNIKRSANYRWNFISKKYEILEIQPRCVPSDTIMPSKAKKDVTGHLSMHLLLSGKEESLHKAQRIIAWSLVFITPLSGGVASHCELCLLSTAFLNYLFIGTTTGRFAWDSHPQQHEYLIFFIVFIQRLPLEIVIWIYCRWRFAHKHKVGLLERGSNTKSFSSNHLWNMVLFILKKGGRIPLLKG